MVPITTTSNLADTVLIEYISQNNREMTIKLFNKNAFQ